MFKLSVSTTFDAAHRLENYPGPCSRMHGHTWTATAEWEKAILDRVGMTLDLVELKKQLRAVVVDMDHCYLNKIRGLPKPTAENIAKLLFERLAKRPPTGEFLVAVTVEETPGCSVRYVLEQHRSAPRHQLGVTESEDERLQKIADEHSVKADEQADERGVHMPEYKDEGDPSSVDVQVQIE